MAPIAVRKCRRVLDHARKVVGLEVLCAAQGLDFLRPLRPGRGVEAAHRRLRREIPHLEADRFLLPEIERVASPDAGLPNEIVAAAERATGGLH
jgi:histidine ammonia-lyase